MAEMPDSSNFYSSLQTSLCRRQIADTFKAAGWDVIEPDDWDHVAVHCPWAELLIESASPVLIHGPVADVEANSEKVLAILERAGTVFTAECYGRDGGMLREWASGSARPTDSIEDY